MQCNKNALVIAALFLGAAAMSHAEWKPGLLGGRATYSSGNWTTVAAIYTNVYFSPHVAGLPYGSSAFSPLRDVTWVYTGEIHMPGGTVWFAKSYDESVLLKINGTTVINNTTYNVLDIKGITLDEGWYPVVIRFANSGNGGPYTSTGWVAQKGLAMFVGSTKSTNPADYVVPLDPGDGSLFRHDNALFSGAYDIVEWIQTPTTANAWIDTLVKCESENIVYDADWEETTLENATSLFGSYVNGTTSKWPPRVYHPAAGQIYCAVGTSDNLVKHTGLTAGFRNTMRITVASGNVTNTLKGTTLSATYNGSVQNGVTIGLLANNPSGEFSKYTRLRYWSMTDNGLTKRMMIPIRMRESGQARMLDIVSGKSFGTCGPGEFIAGPLVTDAATQLTDNQQAGLSAADGALNVAGNPCNYAYVSPEYGRHTGLGTGDTRTLSVASGFDYTNLTDTFRVCCTGLVMHSVNPSTGLVTNTTPLITSFPYTYTHAGASEAEWLWRIENGIKVTPTAGGTVSTNLAWSADPAETLAVIATPYEGFEFACWTGDIPSSVTDTTVNTITLPFNTPRSVTAVFRAIGSSTAYTFVPDPVTGSGNWMNSARWSPVGVPGTNDTASITNGECVVNNTLSAGDIRVGTSGKLRLAALGTAEASAQLAINARSLDIAQSGVVVVGGTLYTLAGIKAQMPDAANLPASISANFSGFVTNAGLLSVGTRSCTNTLSMTIGGDFVMADGSTTSIYADRATNALDLVGLYRQVSPVTAATIELKGNAVLYTENDAWSGGSIKYSCGDFIVAHDAKVDTVNRGYAYFKIANTATNGIPGDMPSIPAGSYTWFTYGPGRSASGAYNGAGHGAQGYGTIQTPSQTKQATGFGQAYGYRLAPYLAGSPGNIYSGPYTGSGSIVVFADRIKVDGTLSAYGGVVDGHGAPSAGGIMLVSDSFDFGPDAVVTAEGTYNKQSASGGRYGAGGRVALLCGFGTEDIATIVAGEEPAEVDVRDASDYFIAAIDAKSGRDWNLTRGSNKGTTCFARPDTLPKRLVAVSGSLGQVRAESATWGFRSRTFASGTPVSLSMNDTSDILIDGETYAFQGWELRAISNLNTIADSGTGASVTVQTDDDYVLTWLWERIGFTMKAAAATGGKITYGGSNYVSGTFCEIFLTCGAESGEITAVPDAGNEFLYWVGDIEPAKARSSTITITSVAPRDITAIFRPVAEPKARVFNAASPSSSGNWLDPARWTDGIVPGLSDSVTIASGTCVVSNYLDTKSVTVASGAKMHVADYSTAGAFVREITAKLTDGNLVVAQGGVAAFGGTTATAAGVKAQTYSTAHLPSRVSLSVAGCVTNSGSLSVGGRGGLYITNTLGVAVASEFVMADGSVTAIYAGRAENPLILTGLWAQASIVSASRFELLGNAVLYPENDAWSGNHVRFVTDGDFTVGASATVDTISRGYNYFPVPADLSADYPADMPYVSSTFRNFTYAPGRAPAGPYVIAAHGGGGNAPTYGWPLAAYLPGSPGNLWSGIHRGSGSIVIVANSMNINGILTAFGGEYNDHGSPSAGGIMLVSGSYEFSPDAIIKAEGPYNKMSQMSGAYGAGGRVSILCGFNAADLTTIVSGEIPEGIVNRDASDYELSASIDALSGKNINLKRGTNNGTTRFARPASLPAYVVTARSSSGTTGNNGMKWNGVNAGYGTRTYASGASVTLTQTATAPFVADGSVCVFAGYEAYDINDRAMPVSTGAVNTVTLTVDRDWLVVWVYIVDGFVMTVPSNDHGSIVYAGPDGDVTYSNGAVAEIAALTGRETGNITADPAAGYEFLYWDGDVPFGKSAQNPIRLTGDAARTISPVFREAQSATTRTFTAGSSTARGYWTSPSFWTPAGIPGPNDDVVINAGECVASNYIAAKSITINTDGKLKVGGRGGSIGCAVNAGERSGELEDNSAGSFLPTDNELLHETRVVVSGNVTLNGNGQFGVGGITPHQRWQDVSIGGNLTLNGTSVMLVSGGETNATFNYTTGTAWVRVGGVFAINDTANFVPQSERYTGGSVKVACRKFVLAEGAKVDALRRGFSQYTKRTPTTLAPGGNTTPGAIAAGVYGGNGGNTYGFEYAPIHPGSPRGTYATGACSGGGLIRIHASSMEIAGTLDANAGDPTGTDYGHGGASGGGIWLTAAQTVKFVGTPSILARGQCAWYSSAGGGGRIAITLTPDQRIIDQLALTGTHPEVVLNSIDRTAFTNAFPNVSASADVDRSKDYSASSPDGTFRYTDIIPRGTLIWLR